MSVMCGFEWVNEVDVDVVYVGSKFIIDIDTVSTSTGITEMLVETWSNDEFIEFEITWIGHMVSDNKVMVVVVVSDCNLNHNSLTKPGHEQIIPIERVRQLIDSGYWKHISWLNK